ncbi:MAG: hypothetical protein KDK70_42605, partial [Myxococcales bacterium]|nr:hypothetical protein [Myxococcales bacterium]
DVANDMGFDPFLDDDEPAALAPEPVLTLGFDDDGLVSEPPPPPAPPVDEFEDDWDEEPAPRRAGPGGYDDDFLDGEGEDFDEGDFEDFGDVGSAPRPLPWKPILLASAAIVAVGVLLFGDYLFPSEPDADEAAQADGAADSDGAAEPEAEPKAKPEAEAKAKPEGEGQPVEPEATSGTPPAADGGATPPPTAAPNPEMLAKLEEARKAYTKANGNARKLAPVEQMLNGILATAPNNPDALTLLAQVYLEQNKLDESLATATKCTTVSPESADCWLTIGVNQEIKGTKDVAKAAYQKYIDLAPEGRYANDANKALKRL